MAADGGQGVNAFPVKSIGVVGAGVVGSAVARSYLEWADVRVWDIVPERRTHDPAYINVSDLIFVCLPTPQKADGLVCDTSVIEAYFADQHRIGMNDRNYVLRSTVPIGFTQQMRDRYAMRNLVHSPEFLTARCATTDAQIPSRNIIGQPYWKGTAHNSKCLSLLEDVYIRRFPGVPIHLMSSDESETVKLAQNSFFLTKLVFFGLLRELTDARGMDWERVRAGVLSDGRIAHAHTMVPGGDGLRGGGGACLPKDQANLTNCMETADVFAGLMHAVREANEMLRRRAN